jgi:hypothetical protein
MDLEKDDVLVSAKLVHEHDEVIVGTSDGKALRYAAAKIPSRSRAAGGVRAIKLGKNARLVSLEIVAADHELLTITELGYGKRTPFTEYNPHGRATAGQLTYHITAKTGPVVVSRTVNAAQELILISKDGIVIRTTVDSIRVTGRQAQGVSVMNLGSGDIVSSVATIDMAPPQGSAPAEGPDAGPSNGDSPSSEPPSGGDSGDRGRAPRTPKSSNGPAASRSRPKSQSKPGRGSGKTVARRTAPKAQERAVRRGATAAPPKRSSSPKRALARADAAMRRADKALSKTHPASRPAPPKKTPAKKPKRR